MLLLSIHPRFADAIFSGVKTVELRRRVPKLSAGDRVVVYATVPRAEILGTFTVADVESRELDDLWRKTRKVAAVSRSEFCGYFAGLERGVGIWIAKPTLFRNSVSLVELRSVIDRFQPPQGFRYLNDVEVRLIEGLANSAKCSRTRAFVPS